MAKYNLRFITNPEEFNPNDGNTPEQRAANQIDYLLSLVE